MNRIVISKVCHVNVFIMLIVIIPVSTMVSTNFFVPENLNLSQDANSVILGFSSNKLLSTNDDNYAHHVEVSMAINDDGVIFAGWKNSESHNGGGARVSFVRSTNGGVTWTQPYDMPMFSGLFTRQSDPWLYCQDGTVYYAYLEFEAEYFNNPSGGYLTQITIAKSTNNGVSWTPVKASNGLHFADKETFVVGEDNTVYLVYDDANVEDPNGNVTIRVTHSIDGGNSYQEISIIGEDEFFVGPYITLNGSGDPFVAWNWVPGGGGNLYLSKSLDMGFTFDTPQIINDDGNFTAFEMAGGTVSKSTLPVIKFDNEDRLYVLWADKFDQATSTWDVYLRYSDNYGINWSNRIRINPSVTGNQWNPDMVIDPTGKLHIVYYSEIGGNYRPYYRTANFTGINRSDIVLSDEIVIADHDTSSIFTRPGEYMSIQLSQYGVPHVIWSDGRNNEMDIYYAHGLTELPPPNPFSIEIIVFIIVMAVMVIVVLISSIRIKIKRNS
ncbi:MAG: sialidase family protein [Candidatus Hermodarchaeota archaeon]